MKFSKPYQLYYDYEFQGWVANRFGFSNTQSWASIIAFMGVSESNSFDLVKELWQDHKMKIKKY